MQLLDIEQGSEEWLDLRKTKVGASDCPVIMGTSPYDTPLSLWKRKMGLGEEKEAHEGMKRGNALEPMVREWYCEQYAISIVPTVILSDEHPWMMASLDGFSLNKRLILEIKCPRKELFEEIARSCKVPEDWNWQAQHQMVTTIDKGVSWTDEVLFLISDGSVPPLEISVKADCRMQERLIQSGEEFYQRMLNFDPPPMSERDYVERSDSAWKDAAAAWISTKKTMEELEDLEFTLRQELISLCNEQPSKGAGVQVCRFPRRGAVDYSKIPELKGIDLEPYRKKSAMIWQLRQLFDHPE